MVVSKLSTKEGHAAIKRRTVLNAIFKLQRLSSLIAFRERNILQLVLLVHDMFAAIPKGITMKSVSSYSYLARALRSPPLQPLRNLSNPRPAKRTTQLTCCVSNIRRVSWLRSGSSAAECGSRRNPARCSRPAGRRTTAQTPRSKRGSAVARGPSCCIRDPASTFSARLWRDHRGRYHRSQERKILPACRRPRAGRDTRAKRDSLRRKADETMDEAVIRENQAQVNRIEEGMYGDRSRFIHRAT